MKFANKLSLTIFLLGLVFIVLISYTTYRLSYISTIAAQSKYSLEITDEISGDLDLLLNEKVKAALTLANSDLIRKMLVKSNDSYESLDSLMRADQIIELNSKWRAIKSEDDAFILNYTANPVAQLLKRQQTNIEDEYGEIFLTNKFGALVASTSKLSTFAHGHKYWWRGSFANGKGAVFYDDRGYDESVGGYVLGLVVPVKSDNEIIGIIKCNLNILGNISEIITDANTNLSGEFKLLRSGGAVVFEDGVEPLSTEVPMVIYEKIQVSHQETFIKDFDNDKWLVAFAEIHTTAGLHDYRFGGTFESIDHVKGNAGESWYILNLRKMDDVLSSTLISTKIVALIITFMTAIFGAGSFLLGRKFSKPLSQLIGPIGLVSKGDFNARATYKSNDEFGLLAQHFNNMADELSKTTTSIESLHVEIDNRKIAETEQVKLQENLQEALAKVLDGFIPICAGCKKIRDESENTTKWLEIERYVENHSEAVFSHGMCPDCVKIYFPDKE